jgi:hypothetical protein
MIRRAVLAAVALTLAGSVAAPAFADVLSSSSGNNYVCVLGTNKTTGVRDGICVWIPGNLT